MFKFSLYLIFLKIALKNVLRNWRHSLATFFTIVFGFAAVNLFDGFIKDLEYRIKEGITTKAMIGDVVIQKVGMETFDILDPWEWTIDKDEQTFIENFLVSRKDVSYRVRFLHITGLISVNEASPFFLGYGYDVDQGSKIRTHKWEWDTLFGSPLYLNLSEPGAIVIGLGLARQLGCKFASNYQKFILQDGNYIPQYREFSCPNFVMISATTEFAQVNAFEAKIVGIVDGDLRELDQKFLQMPLSTAQRLLDTDKITMVSVKLKNSSKYHQFINEFNVQAKQHNFNLVAKYWMNHQYSAYLRGGIQILHGFRNIFMIVLVIISIMSVTNTVMKSVNERVREIGTIRSLGFFSRHVVFLFSFEGFFLGVLACFVGLILTLIITPMVQYLGITHTGIILTTPRLLRLQFVPEMWAVSFIILVMLSTITSFICSRKASKMIIADALRYVE